MARVGRDLSGAKVMIGSELGIPGAFLIKLPKSEDLRGAGLGLFRQDAVSSIAGVSFVAAQSSMLRNHFGTLRGLHLAQHSQQTKVVTCVNGRIRDALVDCRSDSPTFGRSVVVDCLGSSPSAVICPPGVAHGFVSLEPDSIVILTVDVYFDSVPEKVVNAFDTDLGIDWLIPENECIRSERDRSAPAYQDVDFGQ